VVVVSVVPERLRRVVDVGHLDVGLDRPLVTVFAVLGTDALLWVLLFDGHAPMPGMAWLMAQGIPMAAPGAMLRGTFHAGTLDAVLGYVAMWGVMMWAMMHPPMTRFARDFAAAHEGSSPRAAVAVAGFGLAYYLVWLASALLPLTANALLPGGVYGFVEANSHLAVGGALVLTGLYQLSGFKLSRLRTCCASVDAHRADAPAAVRRGLRHGVQCVLVCFGPFFLLMPVVGSMNFFWMLALTTVVTVERLPTWGRELAVSTGVVALLAGLVVLVVRPDLPLVFAKGGGM
jgi:predicted metal-binding membrane protein